MFSEPGKGTIVAPAMYGVTGQDFGRLLRDADCSERFAAWVLDVSVSQVQAFIDGSGTTINENVLSRECGLDGFARLTGALVAWLSIATN